MTPRRRIDCDAMTRTPTAAPKPYVGSSHFALSVFAVVAKTADVCNEAGFVEINFGGGLGTK